MIDDEKKAYEIWAKSYIAFVMIFFSLISTSLISSYLLHKKTIYHNLFLDLISISLNFIILSYYVFFILWNQKISAYETFIKNRNTIISTIVILAIIALLIVFLPEILFIIPLFDLSGFFEEKIMVVWATISPVALIIINLMANEAVFNEKRDEAKNNLNDKKN